LIVLSWLSSLDCPVLIVLSWLSCLDCPVLIVLSWFSCLECPISFLQCLVRTIHTWQIKHNLFYLTFSLLLQLN
jgi:hypothetical protein